MRRRLSTSAQCGVRAIGLFALCVFASMPIAAAQSATVVRPDPASLGLEPGAESTVALRVENVQDLYGLEIHLAFDPSVVEVADGNTAEPGVQVGVAGWLLDGFVAANQVDNASGRIDFAATLLNPAPPFSGSTDFATITFRARQDGVSPLKIEQAILATRDAEVIEAQLQDGLVGVSAKGQAPLPSAQITPGSSSSTSVFPGIAAAGLIWCLAGLSIVAFLVALGVLLLVARSRRRPRT